MTGTMTRPAQHRPAHLPEPARKAARRVRKASKRLGAHAGKALLLLRNLLVRSSATGTADAVVSMTTYGVRIRTVAVALESIARGEIRPRRMILWLDDPRLMDTEPSALRRLRRRGVEVRLSHNYGPHTKYYPYVSAPELEGYPLVTADDDIIYPANWLRVLLDANEAHPDMIHGHWVSTIGVNNGSITQYQAWGRRHDTRPAFNNFALGVSGVIYPPAMLRELRHRGALFMDVCPGADDIWLHWVALRAGIPVRQVDRIPRHFAMIPGSQHTPLNELNVDQHRNDHWIRGLYSNADIDVLAAGQAATGPTKYLLDGENNAKYARTRVPRQVPGTDGHPEARRRGPAGLGDGRFPYRLGNGSRQG